MNPKRIWIPATTLLLGVTLLQGMTMSQTTASPSDASATTSETARSAPRSAPRLRDIYVPTKYDGCCRVDGGVTTYYLDSKGDNKLERDDRKAVRKALKPYRRLGVDFAYDSTPTFSGPAETDLIFQEGPIAKDGVVGRASCNDYSDKNSAECDQFYILIEGGGNYGDQRVTRHEIGHALGLVHGDEASPKVDVCAHEMGIMKKNRTCTYDDHLGALVRKTIKRKY